MVHISRFKRLALILTIGLGVGTLIPALMQKLPVADPVGNNKVLADDGKVDNKETLNQKENFYVKVQDGWLSILQGGPQSAQVQLSGLDVKHWPVEMQSMVTRVEFHSLDEVQSFIDSMSEELWLE